MMPLTIHQRLTPINYTAGRDGHRVRAIVEHITDGDTAASAIKWFHSKASKVSAHFVVDRDGTVYQCVREEDTAWANGVMNKPNTANPIIAGWVHDGVNPNSETVSIECVGRPAQGWTVAQVAVIDLLTRDIALRWGVPIGVDTIIGHRDIDSVNRARCPSLTEAQWDKLRTPSHLSDDQKLDAAWRANAQAYGAQRYAAHLERDWHSGKVLRCDNALLATDGSDLAVTRKGFILDDWEQGDVGLTKL
jgi:N-acetyl-anhydromuramyl-L-alanine amidase AmpD